MQCISCELEIPMGLPNALKGQFNPDIKGVKCRFSAGYTSRFDGLQATFYLCDDCLSLHMDKLVNKTNFWDIFKENTND